MDWLTKLPVIGPVAARFFRTRVWRAYQHLDGHKWARHTASVTFTSFVSLFPMIAVFAAAGVALLSPAQVRSVQRSVDDQVPGIAAKLDLPALAENAGTVGGIAGVLLLLTGVNWVGTLRESLRAVWELEEDPGNVLLLKLKDLGALAGLGLVGLVSIAGSAFAVSAVGRVAEATGLREGGAGPALLTAAGYGAAVAADFALLWYALTVLPGVRPPRRATVLAATMGAVGFELLKLLLGGYLQGVAAKSVYGAFGTPVALLLWISFMARLMLFCTAWTVTEPTRKPIEEIDAYGSGAPETVISERAAPEGGPDGADEAADGETGAHAAGDAAGDDTVADHPAGDAAEQDVTDDEAAETEAEAEAHREDAHREDAATPDAGVTPRATPDGASGRDRRTEGA